MKAKTYKVELTGLSPLLMHADDRVWQDAVKRWQKDPMNKAFSVPGDDRSPAWVWLGYAYQDGKRFGIPSDNLMTMLREGGTKVPKGGKGSYKSETQSTLVVNEIMWPVTINGRDVSWGPFRELSTETDFDLHLAAADRAGFSLHVKPARVGTSKHVRVRPRFDVWSAAGTITVLDDQVIKRDTLTAILGMAGRFCGLGDWRPSSKTPGGFGRFEATITEA